MDGPTVLLGAARCSVVSAHGLRGRSALAQSDEAIASGPEDPDRLILTPHSVGANLAMRVTGTRMAIDAIVAATAGRVPDHVLNPEVVPAWLARFGGEETGG